MVPKPNTTDGRIEDEAAKQLLNDHRETLCWELRMDVPMSQVVKDLKDKTGKYHGLKAALHRPEGHIYVSERTGNVVFQDHNEKNLAVLNPEDTQELAETLLRLLTEVDE